MLKLKGIKRTYSVVSGDVHALKGIDLTFRKSEFVSILGPSGCGKTTMLNIIGGLDKYTAGDLSINGRSTKEFGDRDWDAYRNHNIGFVFQAYNLIPHQTILGNVELALTISGVDKEERVKRAKALLDKVGLAGMYAKKPNQLSGGQCQRVAIARALINEPDILLADEPTGALDTETSVQIMELIKEISKERLVIMVTHNPELADEYSTRIVKLKDGLVIEDSNPYDETKDKKVSKEVIESKTDKPKMGLFTSFRLSLQNLLSKSKRTFMTAFAGAIGIIGISAVLSVSTGVNNFIDNMQEEMLAGSPITISESAFNFEAMFEGMSTAERAVQGASIVGGWVGIHDAIENLVDQIGALENMMIENDIDENFVQFLRQMPEEYGAVVDFDYGLNLLYSMFTDFRISSTDQNNDLMSLHAIQSTYVELIRRIAEYDETIENVASMLGMLGSPFNQISATEEQLLVNYEFFYGDFPQGKNELLIVLDSNNEISDLTLARLGILNQDEFIARVEAALDGLESGEEEIMNAMSTLRTRIDIADLMDVTFTWMPNDELFAFNVITPPATVDDSEPGSSAIMGQYNHLFTQEEIGNAEGAVELTVSGIVKLREGINHGMLTSGFYHTPEFAQHVISVNENSDIVEFLYDNDMNSILTMDGIPAGIRYDLTIRTNDENFDVPNVPLGSPVPNFFPGMEDLPPMYTITMRELGGINLPEEISIFTVSFEDQNTVLAYLGQWNDRYTTITLVFEDERTVELAYADRQTIVYQNILGAAMAMVGTFIDIVTIALIAFTALSLVVSSVMIAIITYVSVVERIKEIGVIRSLGGRKKDVSRLFNAETFFIGFLSGVAGITITLILSTIINLLVRGAIGMNIAVLTLPAALIMITISVLLNMIAGFLPSRMAAKKDPVVALRSE